MIIADNSINRGMEFDPCLFTRHMGYTPMRTYSLLRLQYSITLLSRSNLSIKEIAERCGYEDPLYFS